MISTAHKVTTVNLFIIYNFYDIIKKINFEKGLKPEQSEQVCFSHQPHQMQGCCSSEKTGLENHMW